ncbi:hypothetical protein D3C76_761450 [compost metagenome]
MVLQVAEGQGAERGGDVDHEDQQQGVLGAEAHGLVGIDGGQGDHRRDSRLIAQGAQQKAQQVAVAARLAQRARQARPGLAQAMALVGAQLRLRPFAQEQKGRQAGQGEQHGGDQHAHRDELRRLLPAPLRPGDIRQAGAEAEQATEIAQPPPPAGNPAERIAARQFGQEGGDQVLTGTEEEARQHHEQHRQGERTGACQRQAGGAQHAADGGQQQQALLAGAGIGVGPHQRRTEDHQQIGQGDGAGPGQGAPVRPAGHHGDEEGVEHGRGHHRGVAGVGEVVHGPGPDFAALYSRDKTGGH